MDSPAHFACQTRWFLRPKWQHKINFTMSEQSPPPEVTLFKMQSGRIESDAGQEAVNRFAADFQGLRHFGAKIGEALELGDPWQGAFREADYTLMFVYPSVGVGPDDPGQGGMIAARVPLYEMVETLVTEE